MLVNSVHLALCLPFLTLCLSLVLHSCPLLSWCCCVCVSLSTCLVCVCYSDAKAGLPSVVPAAECRDTFELRFASCMSEGKCCFAGRALRVTYFYWCTFEGEDHTGQSWHKLSVYLLICHYFCVHVELWNLSWCETSTKNQWACRCSTPHLCGFLFALFACNCKILGIVRM